MSVPPHTPDRVQIHCIVQNSGFEYTPTELRRVRELHTSEDTAVTTRENDSCEQVREGASDGTTDEGSEASFLLRTCPPITHADITDKVKEGGYIRGAILEAQDNGKKPRYAVFLLVSWRKGYCVLHVHWPARPRLFRDLDRLLVLLRFEYGFDGTIAIKRLSDVLEGKRHWRVTL